MADVNLGSVSLTARFLTGRFRKDINQGKVLLNRHKAEVRAYAKAWDRAGDDVSRSVRSMARVAGGIGVVGASYAAAVTQALEFAKVIDQNARRAQLSSERFQTYANAFARLGLDADDTRDALSDLLEAVSELATNGQGPLNDFRKVLGSDLQGALQQAVTRAEQLELVFRRLRDIDPSQQQFIAVRLTDSTTGQVISEYLRQYQHDIAQVEQDMRRRGLILPASVTQAATSLSANISALQTIIRNDVVSLLVGHTETLQRLLGGLERTMPEVVARLYGVAGLLDRNLDTIAFLTRHSVIGAGAIAPGLAVGQLQGQLAIAQQTALQAQLRTGLQVAAGNVLALEAQGRATAAAIAQQNALTTALANQTTAIQKAASPLAAMTRAGLGVAGAFGILEVASYGLSALFDRLTRVDAQDLAAGARGIAKSLQDAIDQGAPQVVQDTLTAQLISRIDAVDRLIRLDIERNEDAARAARKTLEELAQVGRRAQRSDPSRTRVARQTLAAYAPENAGLAALSQDMDDLRATAARVSREIANTVNATEQQRAAVQAALPYLSQDRQELARVTEAHQALSHALAVGGIDIVEFGQALAGLVPTAQAETRAIDLSTNAIVRNTRARQEADNAIQRTIDDLASQQSVLDAELAAGPFGLSNADRAEARLRAEFALEQLTRDRAHQQAQDDLRLLRQAEADARLSGLPVDSGLIDQAQSRVAQTHADAEAYRQTADLQEKAIEGNRRFAESQDLITARAELFQTAIGGIGDAFAAGLIDADNFGDAIKRLGVDILGLVLNGAIRSFFQGFGGETGFGGVGNFFGGFFGGREFGGNLFSGQTAIVGEAGPELVTAARPVRVIPNHRLRDIGSGVTVNNTFNVQTGTWTPTETARAIALQQDAATIEARAAQQGNKRTMQNAAYR